MQQSQPGFGSTRILEPAPAIRTARRPCTRDRPKEIEQPAKLQQSQTPVFIGQVLFRNEFNGGDQGEGKQNQIRQH
jgi:hypothetical protein